MLTTDQLRKLIEEKKVTIGTAATAKALRLGQLKRVVIAANAAAATRDSLQRGCTTTGVAVDELSVPNDQLGTMCKKPFAISVLGIRA